MDDVERVRDVVAWIRAEARKRRSSCVPWLQIADKIDPDKAGDPNHRGLRSYWDQVRE
ncbi:hypothetical protein [Embleya scabrispora]|uniref:hypothetical protein n=1 Tax=Embleya scabrispora TaxID=159449 RepID=UPI00137534E3|nr:hypothetical protein [Embleya scabrispora]